jgi:hypothetical protein
MFRSLTELFGRKQREHVPDFEDAVLGNLRFIERNLWGAHLTIAGKRMGFSIAGHTQPSSALLAHARDIVQNFENFENMISTFLAEEARRIEMTPNEIGELEVAEVILCWPEKPNDGMIYFSGPEDVRVWRCDYINRKPQNLGFDD